MKTVAREKGKLIPNSLNNEDYKYRGGREGCECAKKTPLALSIFILSNPLSFLSFIFSHPPFLIPNPINLFWVFVAVII